MHLLMFVAIFNRTVTTTDTMKGNRSTLVCNLVVLYGFCVAVQVGIKIMRTSFPTATCTNNLIRTE